MATTSDLNTAEKVSIGVTVTVAVVAGALAAVSARNNWLLASRRR